MTFRRFVYGQDGERIDVTTLHDVAPAACYCRQPGCAQTLDPDRPYDIATIGQWFGLTFVEDSSLPPDAVVIVSGGQEYAFTVDPVQNPCTTCKGDGEITEFPPDDDERMVCCPACGGTGEALT